MLQPTLNRLAAQTQQSFSAVVLDGDEVVIVARSGVYGAPSRVLAYGLHLGARLPAHPTSTGRVLLAALQPAQLTAWLKGRTLQRLTPITASGATDAARPVVYVGQTQVLTPAGALPLSFEVAATSLEDAVAKFGEMAKQALARTMRRLEELRREQASSIIVPGAAPPTGGAGPGGRILR